MSVERSAGPLRPDTVRAHREAASRAAQMMRENLAEDISLQDVADAAYISPYHFNRVFRSVAGIPPGRFLSALRIQEAKRLLLSSDLSVTDVCFEVGFNSLGTFSRRFAQLTGLPPRRLRTLAAEEGAMKVPGHSKRRKKRAPPLVQGELLAPSGFAGPVFIGLFPGPIPQGRPRACTIARVPGPFSIHHAPTGKHFLFAAAFPDGTGFLDKIVCAAALRGARLEGPLRVRQGRTSQAGQILLRPPETVDPPILLTFPLLLSEHRQRARNGHLPAPTETSSNLGEAPPEAPEASSEGKALESPGWLPE